MGGKGGERTGATEAEGLNRGRENPLGPTGTLAALREARGRRMDEGKGGRNGLAARDFRGREGHWVAGRGWQGREALGRVVEAGGRGRCPGGQSA